MCQFSDKNTCGVAAGEIPYRMASRFSLAILKRHWIAGPDLRGA